MNSSVAVVILNWNGKKFLDNFLPSVIKNSGNAEVIVADNASTDDSVAFLQDNFPGVRIIRNSSNLGFAGGYNEALVQVKSDFYVLLNSDIEVTPGWIEPVITLMESDPAIAACQPKILSYVQQDTFEYAGAAGGFIDKFGYPFCRGRLFQTLEKDTGQYDDVTEIFWATGACMFVRSSVFHKLGGFDDRFFAHMEEIDFCWRARIEGYRIMFCPDSKIYHVGGGTLPKKSARKTYLNMRNNNIMMYKNLPSEKILPVFAARLILDGIASIKFLVDGGVQDFFAVIRAHWRFFGLIPQLSRERKTSSLKEVTRIYRGNIVSNYFLKGKKKFSQLNQDKFS